MLPLGRAYHPELTAKSGVKIIIISEKMYGLQQVYINKIMNIDR